MKTMKIIITLSLVALLALSCAQQGGSGLEGKWTSEAGDGSAEFLADGTAKLGNPDGSILAGSWKIAAEGKLLLSVEGDSNEFAYKLSGGILELTRGSQTMRFKK